MDQDRLRFMANAVFQSIPGAREGAPNNVMSICLKPGHLQKALETSPAPFDASVWFESYESHKNGPYDAAVVAALEKPGACVVKVGEDIDKDRVRWYAAGCYLFDGME